MFKLEEVKAHCDVPCGIYDPAAAQIAALSVIRMIDLIDETIRNKSNLDDASFHNAITRHIMEKETEAIRCKEEIRIIWGDFIKPEHLLKHKNIHTLVHNIMMLGSAVKQHVSRDKALELLVEINKFSEIFWAIKGMKTKTVKSPYAPAENVVIPIL